MERNIEYTNKLAGLKILSDPEDDLACGVELNDETIWFNKHNAAELVKDLSYLWGL